MAEFRLSQEQFEALHSDLETQGGFTVDPGTGAPRTKGISVAPAKNEVTSPIDETSPADIREYHDRPQNQERYARGASLGGWRSDKKKLDYLDTPTVYPETPGGHARARNQMLKSNQLAAYHISRGVEELNPFHPGNQDFDVVSSDNSPEQQKIWAEMPRHASTKKGKKLPLVEGQSFT